MRTAVLALALAAAIPALAVCSEPAGIGELASSLSNLRDTCSMQAQNASAAEQVAMFKAGLDAQSATTKAQMDAQVYNVGHGDRETRDFLLNRIQENNDAADAARQKINDKAKSDAASVKECVASAEQQGKDAYIGFVKHHKKAASDAKPLMAAWLANLDEISFDTPIGTPQTAAAWKAAKADAEVAAL